MLTIRLVVVLALSAIQARIHLGTATNTLPNLGQGDLGSNAQDFANNFVPDGQRVRAASPIATYGVHVTGTDTTAFDLDVDVVVAKGTRGPGVFLKFEPFFGGWGLKATELVRIGHCSFATNMKVKFKVAISAEWMTGMTWSTRFCNARRV